MPGPVDRCRAGRSARAVRGWVGALCAMLVVSCLANTPLRADVTDCFGTDSAEVDKIQSCTAVIETPDIEPALLAEAYAARALAYSMRGRYEPSIADYDKALDLNPNYAAALNNRAWAYYKKGEPLKGLPDAERSLAIDPFSAPSYDTRAHIRQWLSEREGALTDYNRAIRLADKRLVKLYQCGLKNHGFYSGPIDGIKTAELYSGMRACVNAPSCDPLPTDEECPNATS